MTLAHPKRRPTMMLLIGGALSVALTCVVLLFGAAPAQAQDPVEEVMTVVVRHEAIGDTPLPDTWEVTVDGDCLDQPITQPLSVQDPVDSSLNIAVPARCWSSVSLGSITEWLSTSIPAVKYGGGEVTFTVVPASALSMQVTARCVEVAPGVTQGQIKVFLTKNEDSDVSYLITPIQGMSGRGLAGSAGTDVLAFWDVPDFVYTVSAQALGGNKGNWRRALLTQEVTVDCQDGPPPSPDDGLVKLNVETVAYPNGSLLERFPGPDVDALIDIDGPCLTSIRTVRAERSDFWWPRWESVVTALPRYDEAGQLCRYTATAQPAAGLLFDEPVLQFTIEDVSPLALEGDIQLAPFFRVHGALPGTVEVVVHMPLTHEATMSGELRSSCLDSPRFIESSNTSGSGGLGSFTTGDIVELTEMPIAIDGELCVYEFVLTGAVLNGIERDIAEFSVRDEVFDIFDSETTRYFVRYALNRPDPEIEIRVFCAGGSGRAEVNFVNRLNVPVDVSARFGELPQRSATLQPRSSEQLAVTGRPDGDLDIEVYLGDQQIFGTTETVDCQPDIVDPDPPVDADAAPSVEVSCLSGNGRVDVTLPNPTAADVEFAVTIGRLVPRPQVVAAGQIGRVTATGRTDGVNAVFIRRDGVPFWSAPTVVDCDPPVPAVVTWSCLAERARVDALLTNSGAEAATYEVTVGSVGPRIVVLAPGDSQVVSVSGRADGPHLTAVTQDGVQVYKRTEQVRCAV